VIATGRRWWATGSGYLSSMWALRQSRLKAKAHPANRASLLRPLKAAAL
jgi:hypothetical protein